LHPAIERREEVALRDIRQTRSYKDVEAFYRHIMGPSFGRITQPEQLAVSPDGKTVAFAGRSYEELKGHGTTRIAAVPFAGGEVRTLTNGPNDDHSPAWSPDGRTLAFLSDRATKDEAQLYLLSGDVGEARPAPKVKGIVEYIAWSPDGTRILMGVAEEGAELAGAQGSGRETITEDLPGWMPQVRSTSSPAGWRRLYMYDVANDAVSVWSRDGLNVWEAAWAGPHDVVAVASEDPGEASWYRSPLVMIDDSGKERLLYESDEDQLGYAVASDDGELIAVIEAFCSDRYIVAGEIVIVSPTGELLRRLHFDDLDATYLVWHGRTLFAAGLSDLNNKVVRHDFDADSTRTILDTTGCISPIFNPVIYGAPTGVVAVAHAHDRPYALVHLDDSERVIASFEDEATGRVLSMMGTMETVSWDAPDGLEIHGYLVTPEGDGPHPTITFVHGGPVGAQQNWWMMRDPMVPLLVGRGYAAFFPNPRGSSGRGRDFAIKVKGDMGGGDATDVISGVEALVERGIADPERLGVTGGSYGGFMSCELVTQTDMFKASVPIAPVSNFISQHNTSNIGAWDQEFITEPFTVPGGKYHEQSPIMFVDRVTTPTFLTAGAADRCTPPTQAWEFHQALEERGVETDVAIYPNEGHGVRNFPAIIDHDARVLAWFDRHVKGALPE
jgi:dipeptidyl aminopeptidase/acylaminoacyl peptidase